MGELAGVDPEDVRQLAKYKFERLARSIDNINQQFLSVSGWLNASLFALNGGGALASVNAVDRLDSPAWPVAVFAVGLIFAMISAVLIQRFLSVTIPHAEKLLEIWRSAEIYGELDEGAYEMEKGALLKAESWSWTPQALGWVSGLCFLAGGAVFAIDEVNPPPRYQTMCKRLQTEMLTSSRTSPRELFTSLKCQWQE